MKDKLIAAGVDAEAAALRVLAYDCLRKNDCNPLRSLSQFSAALQKKPNLLSHIVLRYLQECAKDMLGASQQKSECHCRADRPHPYLVRDGVPLDL